MRCIVLTTVEVESGISLYLKISEGLVDLVSSPSQLLVTQFNVDLYSTVNEKITVNDI